MSMALRSLNAASRAPAGRGAGRGAGRAGYFPAFVAAGASTARA